MNTQHFRFNNFPKLRFYPVILFFKILFHHFIIDFLFQIHKLHMRVNAEKLINLRSLNNP